MSHVSFYYVRKELILLHINNSFILNFSCLPQCPTFHSLRPVSFLGDRIEYTMHKRSMSNTVSSLGNHVKFNVQRKLFDACSLFMRSVEQQKRHVL